VGARRAAPRRRLKSSAVRGVLSGRAGMAGSSSSRSGFLGSGATALLSAGRRLTLDGGGKKVSPAVPRYKSTTGLAQARGRWRCPTCRRLPGGAERGGPAACRYSHMNGRCDFLRPRRCSV
jgi:hypothetical protein